mmetsp:Transcript_54340/g.140348  ORF Transcript_54340/g.140348 Transcript_54340/m.140348 type:complete len:282 (+) Transcript_54340:750-1595(+)
MILLGADQAVLAAEGGHIRLCREHRQRVALGLLDLVLEISDLDLDPGAHLVARARTILEALACVCYEVVIAHDDVAGLEGCLEAAELLEFAVEKIHSQPQHRRDAQPGLLMARLDPEAHVAEAHAPIDLEVARIILGDLEDREGVAEDAQLEHLLGTRQVGHEILRRRPLAFALFDDITREGTHQLVHDEPRHVCVQAAEGVACVGHGELAALGGRADAKQADDVEDFVARGAIGVPRGLPICHREENVVRLVRETGRLDVEEAAARTLLNRADEATDHVV